MANAHITPQPYVYKVRIDYDGFVTAESMYVKYRWGTTGGWTTIAYYDWFADDRQWTISDAESSTLDVLFVDGLTSDMTSNSWLFGSEPELWMYWN